MQQDKFEIEFDEDGSIKVTTDEVSQVNHRNAEDFLAFLARATGGTVTRTKRAQDHAHQHQHQHSVIKQKG